MILKYLSVTLIISFKSSSQPGRRISNIRTSQSRVTLHATLLRPFIFISLLFFASCKLTENNARGHFVLKNGKNTFFNIDTSGQFTYIQCNPLNPLLYNTEFVSTKGIWTFQDNKYITLNSLPENKDYRKVKIEKTNATHISSFTFYDIFGDTLPILGATKNGDWFGRVHSLMKSFELNLSPGDTITADIPGYDKFILIYSDTAQFSHQIEMYPKYISDYFKNKKLLLKRNKIIDAQRNETYKKKSGM